MFLCGSRIYVERPLYQAFLDKLVERIKSTVKVVDPTDPSTTLGALTEMETSQSQGVIKRYNLRRAITVEANMDKGREDAPDTITANKIIQDEWDKIATRYPGVTLDFSGELEDVQESLDAMPGLFLLGVGLISLILAAQFKSYWQPLMILVTVPLAFTVVTLGLVFSQNPLSLYTMYGIIALTGIAVNSAIVLIDAANERLKSGMGLLHASIYAARRRVIPIITRCGAGRTTCRVRSAGP